VREAALAQAPPQAVVAGDAVQAQAACCQRADGALVQEQQHVLEQRQRQVSEEQRPLRFH